MIDRGPDTAEVVRRASAPLRWATTIASRGNHEATMLEGAEQRILETRPPAILPGDRDAAA